MAKNSALSALDARIAEHFADAPEAAEAFKSKIAPYLETSYFVLSWRPIKNYFGQPNVQIAPLETFLVRFPRLDLFEKMTDKLKYRDRLYKVISREQLCIERAELKKSKPATPYAVAYAAEFENAAACVLAEDEEPVKHSRKRASHAEE